MKQYQIITTIVICLTVFTVYQIQKGLLQKTHSFIVESFERLPESPSLLPASGDATLPVDSKKFSKPEGATKPARVKEKIKEVKTCSEFKVSEKDKVSKATGENTAKVKKESAKVKTSSRVLVKESNSISGVGCMGFILY